MIKNLITDLEVFENLNFYLLDYKTKGSDARIYLLRDISKGNIR